MDDQRIPENFRHLTEWMQILFFYGMVLFVSYPGFYTVSVLLTSLNVRIPDAPWIPFVAFVLHFAVNPVFILAHEALHYFAARMFHVPVAEFSWGTGKKRFRGMIGKSEFNIREINMGGFVKTEHSPETPGYARLIISLLPLTVFSSAFFVLLFSSQELRGLFLGDWGLVMTTLLIALMVQIMGSISVGREYDSTSDLLNATYEIRYGRHFRTIYEYREQFDLAEQYLREKKYNDLEQLIQTLPPDIRDSYLCLPLETSIERSRGTVEIPHVLHEQIRRKWGGSPFSSVRTYLLNVLAQHHAAVFLRTGQGNMRTARRWNRMARRRCGNLPTARLMHAILLILNGRSRHALRVLGRINELNGVDVSLFRFFGYLAAFTAEREEQSMQYKFEIDGYIPEGGYRKVFPDTFIVDCYRYLGCPIDETWGLDPE